MIKKFLILAIFFFLSNNYSHASDVPIIVIAPSKKPQSISTVGSSVIVLDEKFFDKNNEYFLGDVLSNYSTSINFFQSGGHGTASAIQLRGLPKDILQFTLTELKCQIHQVYQEILILIIF